MAKKGRTSKEVLEEQEQQAKAQRSAGNTAVVKAASNALTTDDSNPWLEVSAELDKFLGAPLLKFTKQGEFSISDIENIPDNTRCIAHADEIEFGWVKWVDGKPADRRMGRVADKFVPPPRSDLDDIDEHSWEMQEDGTRRDPWQFQASVPITRLDAGGETYCFTTGSKGGLGCVNKLTRTYGSRIKTEKVPGLPIIELKADSYKHRTYGKIFVPNMIVVGWTGPTARLCRWPTTLTTKSACDLSLLARLS
jgi:hypothetical protein